MRKTKVKIRHVHVMIISLLIISLFIYGIIGKTKQKDIKEVAIPNMFTDISASVFSADCP